MNQIRQVYFVGIGGIGMSGLARYFKHRGCQVYGYDRTATPLTAEMIAEGMDICFEDELKYIPEEFKTFAKDHPEQVLIIYTPAIPKNSIILNYFITQGFELKKRAEVLGMISADMFTIAVAGTHGKTTTSTMIAHILKHSGYDCSAFLGGISSNYHSNVLFGNNNVLVVEADEFDRSFLHLHPDIAVITSMDADHLDIYGDKDNFKESFRLFASQLKEDGVLIRKAGLPLDSGFTYSLSSTDISRIMGKNVRIEEGQYKFDYLDTETDMQDIILGLPGWHNVENAVAAIAVAFRLGIGKEKIKVALQSFSGVKRRFEYIVKTDKCVFIDDYAHHPEELKACIKSVRQLYENRKLTMVFQPHLFSRTRDFAKEFAEVLGTVDQLILLPIYPARELPIDGVHSEMILDMIKMGNKKICSKAQLAEEIKALKPELLVSAGAGDIDQLVQPLKAVLLEIKQ